MAQDPKMVAAKLKTLQGDLLQLVSKELADLPDLLYSNETIYAVASGNIDNHNWLLVVTERRIFLTYHGTLGGRQNMELPLNQVKSVSCKTGMLFGELLIDTGGQTKTITKVQKVHARKVAEEVSRLLHAPKPAASATPAVGDSLTRLERLAELHEKGVLTDEEFAAQKQAILSLTTSTTPLPATPDPAPVSKVLPTPTPEQETPASPKPPKKKGGFVGKFLKIVGGIFVVLIVLGLVVDKFVPNKDKKEVQPTQSVPASAPVTQPQQAAQSSLSEAGKQKPTTDQVRTEVAALLAELDGFRNTATFKQCVYGCGRENPAKAWNLKRNALQEQMNPQLDVPILLKVAPSELYALGMAYAKGRANEAKELRVGIEKALQQEQQASTPITQNTQAEAVQNPQEVQATTTTKAVQNTELPWSRKSVIANYNAAASALKLPRVNAKNARHTQGVADAWNYTLSPYTSIVLSSNLGSNHITGAIFIGAGDGTEQSGVAIILSAICTMTALTPDATGDQRSALFKKLGLLDGSISDGQEHKATFGPAKFSASFTTTTGLMLAASPVEQKESL